MNSGKGKVLIGGGSKQCADCKISKTFANFSKDKSSPTGLAYYCRDCASRRTREHHSRMSLNPAWLERKREKGRSLARDAKRRAVEYMGGGCHDCGAIYPDYVYDFHHLSGDTKVDNPSAILKRSWGAAKEELDKCVMVCANCHRERHYGSR